MLEHPAMFEAKFVVHTDAEVVFVTENFREANDWRVANLERYKDELMLFLVPRNFGLVRLRMLKVRSLTTGEWMPTYQVKFFLEDGNSAEVEMMVDSGADISFIPKDIGEQMGFVKSFGEPDYIAAAVGNSTIPYVARECRVEIAGHQLNIRLLWCQDETTTDILLGRMDVFDYFDVTFSQRRRTILFSKSESEI